MAQAKRVGDYILGRTIGQGSDSRVVYAQHAITGEHVAVKIMDKEAMLARGGARRFPREVAALRRLCHPHAVAMLCVLASPTTVYLVTELVSGGDLYDRIVGEGPLPEPEARRLFCQLLSVVGACHMAGVYHRDIKPENVLLTAAGDAKLADFGLGALQDNGGVAALLRTACGTMHYAAPEVLRGVGYRGGPADVWSLGVVLFVMLAGRLPFDEDDTPALMQRIAVAAYDLPPWVSPGAAATLRAMLCPDPAARASVDEVWETGWVAGGDDDHLRLMSGAVLEDVAVIPQTTPLLDGTLPASHASRGPASATTSRDLASPSKMNAFQLLRANFDISALFEGREDVVKRRTRFTCGGNRVEVLARIRANVLNAGGSAEAQEPHILSLSVPVPAGIITVKVESNELVPGRYILDVFRVTGSSPAFYRWYTRLLTQLRPYILQSKPLAPSPSRALAAFEVINRGLDLNALFGSSTTRQFSSRAGVGLILDGVRRTAVALGCTCTEADVDSLILAMSPPCHKEPGLRCRVRAFAVLHDVQVCQVSMEQGDPAEFARLYARLAGERDGAASRAPALAADVQGGADDARL